MSDHTTNPQEQKSRGKLFLLWTTAAILGVVSFGIFIYIQAKSDAEQFWMTYGIENPHSALKGISFSTETWITLEFTIREAELSDSNGNRHDAWWLKFMGRQDLNWSLRDFAIKDKTSARFLEGVPGIL